MAFYICISLFVAFAFLSAMLVYCALRLSSICDDELLEQPLITQLDIED